ncbi:MAG: helix-turn-helix transcriptional regulator [bacterium]
MPDFSDLAAAFAAVLDALPQPIVIVEPDATVRHANVAAREILQRGDCLAERNERLRAADAEDTARLANAIRATAQPQRSHDRGRLIAIGAATQRLTLLLWSLASQPPGARLTAIFIDDPAAHAAMDEALLRERYGLTRAEARLAALLADGCDIAQAVTRLRIGRSTARTHLQRIMAKTGVTRQAALARLLLRGPAHLRPRRADDK